MSTRKSAIFYGVLISFVSVVIGIVIASRLDLAPDSFASTLSVPATNSAPLTGPLDASTFRNIAHDASPSVVSIVVLVKREARANSLFDFGTPFGDLPFGNRRGQQPDVQTVPGAGSGFIIDKAGYILTNNHVVADATSIEVRLSSMSDAEYTLPAKLIGRDELSDTALIQLTELPKEALIPAKFGDSDQLAPGDWTVAIGSPFGLTNTVSVGVVSAVGRDIPGRFAGRSEEMIQTDAAINPGNSGGPLLNIRGEVIGINSMIFTTEGEGGGNVGVGFAIPINTVRDLLPDLRTGKVTRGRIGVELSRRPITQDYATDLGLPSTAGVEVTRVNPVGPAHDAGMRAGDVIIEFNGKPIKNSGELQDLVTHTAPGTTVPVKVVRDKKTQSLNVKVEELNLTDEGAAVANAQPQRPDRQTPRGTAFGMTLSGLTAAERRDAQVPSGRGGAIVTQVEPYSAAAQGGLRPGDVILSVQGQAVSSVDEAVRALDAIASGRTTRLIIWRQGDNRTQSGENLIQLRKP